MISITDGFLIFRGLFGLPIWERQVSIKNNGVSYQLKFASQLLIDRYVLYGLKPTVEYARTAGALSAMT